MQQNFSKPICLIILDGWGIAPPSKGNAVAQAKTPNISSFFNTYPHTQLDASENAVGLPNDEPGNSEAGHLNLGAGSIVLQSLPKINTSIADGTFFKSTALKKAVEHANKYNSNLHLMGLIGSGGVHSNIDHLSALLNFCKQQNLTKVYLHLFTDGRDSSPTSSIQYLKQIEEQTKNDGLGKIATLMGRFYAMDRDHRWERTKLAYEALTEGKGRLVSNYKTAIQESYNQEKTDEFIKPIILTENKKPVSIINDNDAVIFFNFRIDRPRQLTKAFVLPDFENMIIRKAAFDPYAERYGKRQYEDEGKKLTTFQRKKVLTNLLFVTMTEYEPGLPVLNIFPPDQVAIPLARVLSENGWRQLHIAETEKERHVTYFFNGKRENPFPGEDWTIIPSPKVQTYDQQPEMSAPALTNELEKRIKLNIYDFILVNFANPDMVGHTGNIKAGIKACEIVDSCVGRVVNLATKLGGTCLITADHGNVEEMLDLNTGKVDTKHSTFPVPFIAVNNNLKGRAVTLPTGILADIAPTILKLGNIPKSNNMTGKSLI
jgi:2,3-bisphosphoglycerate-independent phosphoglycerate mutase